MPEREDEFIVISCLKDWARWSTKAAETAKQMSRSAMDHRGGRTPNRNLRSLVTILLDRFEGLLAIKATHVIDTNTGLGHSKFDLFVKEAIRFHAPPGSHFEPRLVDEAIRWAMSGRRSSLKS